MASLNRNPEYGLLRADVEGPGLVQQLHLSDICPGASWEGLQHLHQAGFSAARVEGQFPKKNIVD